MAALDPINFDLKGSINPQQCEKGISYHAIICRKENGERKQLKKTFPDWNYDHPIEAAKAWLIQKNPRLSDEDFLDQVDVGVVEYLKSWHHENVNSIRDKTKQKREWALFRHVFPFFDGNSLDAMNTFEIENFYQQKLKHLSPTSVKIIDQVLTLALNDAVDDGILETNPAKNIGPTRERTTMTIYDETQICEFLDESRQYHDYVDRAYNHHPIFYTLFNTGLRIGEILGLRFRNLDLESGYIKVEEALKQHSQEGLTLGPLKTDSSYRTVKLTDKNVSVLKDYLRYRETMRREADEWHGVDTIVATSKGKYMWQSSVRRKLGTIIEGIHAPKISLHEFRHTHATQLLRSGVSIYNVSRRLGHSSIKTTERRYLGYVPSMQKETVDKYQQSMDF